jgi:protein-tyrosine phosphatase
LSERQRDGGIDRIPLPSGVAGELRLCGKRAIGVGRFEAPDMPWTTVVCLCQRHELDTRYPAYVNWLDTDTDTDPERSIWWPIHDLGAEPVEAMLPFVDDLVERLRAGERLLVHCAAGLGRAGTTAVCILVRLGVPIDEATRTVADARPMAGPEAGSQRALVLAVARATPPVE